MAYEKKPGDVTLFTNNYKDNDRKPDFKGDGLDINGNPIKVAAWKRTDRNGKEYLSLKIEAAQDSVQAPAAAPAAPAEDPNHKPLYETAKEMNNPEMDLPF